MQPEIQTQTPVTTSNVPKHSHFKFQISIVAVLVLAIAACYLIYSWQHKKVEQLIASKSQLITIGTQSDKSKSSASSSYSVNVARGYPLSLPKKKVLISLYMPNENSILQTELVTHTQDELASNYTESANDIIANWIFNDTGTASNPSDWLSANQNITITALNQ